MFFCVCFLTDAICPNSDTWAWSWGAPARPPAADLNDKELAELHAHQTKYPARRLLALLGRAGGLYPRAQGPRADAPWRARVLGGPHEAAADDRRRTPRPRRSRVHLVRGLPPPLLVTRAVSAAACAWALPLGLSWSSYRRHALLWQPRAGALRSRLHAGLAVRQLCWITAVSYLTRRAFAGAYVPLSTPRGP